ncbi:MAG: CopG family transcriptional regulator [Nanoarchaeota archaeon]|nr:CopG family transcriptional regulator [Nanoarchaeota archaeon]
MSESNITTISIPRPLADKLKKRIAGTGFNSVSSYVTYILRQVISGSEMDKRKEAFSEEDERKVKDRLRGLGYLD